MTSNPKPTRSRYSSPLQLSSSPSGHNRGPGAHHEERILMRRWLEPPVQNKASYQEAGLVKAGVVENMAPLGTLPKPAIAKKSALPGPEHGNGAAPPAVKRIVLKKPLSAAAAPVPVVAAAAEESTPPPHISGAFPEVDDSDAIMLSPSSRPFLSLPVMDDGEDEDYVPNKSSKAGRTSLTTKDKNPSHSPSNMNIDANSTTTRRQSSRRKSARPSPPPPASPVEAVPSPFHAPPSILNRQPQDKDLADKVVEFAVEEALAHYRYPTAWALRLLYDENSNDPQFVSMIEDIYHQKADRETLREFNRLISEKKRDGKKENKGCYYFVPPSTGNRFTPRKPKPAPYATLVRMDLSTFKEVAPDADGRATKKIKLEKSNDALLGPGTGIGADADEVNGAGLDSDLNSAAASTTTAGTTAVSTAAAGTAAPAAAATPAPAAAAITAAADTTAAVAATPMAAAAAPMAAAATPTVAAVTPTAAAATPAAGITRAPVIRPTAAAGLNGIKSTRSPQRKKKRSGSVSSSSSLSSVPEDMPDDYDEYMDQVDDDLAVSRPRSAEGNDAPDLVGPAQPISAAQRKLGTKKKNVSPKPASHPSNATHTTTTPNPHDSSMPAAVITNGASHRTPGPLKFASKYAELDAASEDLSNQKVEKRLENRRLTTAASADSFVRDGLGLDELPEDAPAAQAPPAVVASAEQSRCSRTPALSGRAARAAKRNHDEVEDPISPTSALFQTGMEPPSSRRNSRAATPSNLRPAKKPRGGLRVKTSPMKKKGTSAGIPRGGGDRPSPAANGPQASQDDNDDSCYTCGGNGELVCCDGCNYSFHFLCIDPPMSEGHMPDEWYCNECTQRYFPPIGERKGAFSDFLAVLERKNPRAFRLPEDIREHFEGVRTGPDGEYEDSAPVAKPKTNKKGYEEAFDFFKVKNVDGSPALCHLCHKAAADDRPLIPCSVCGLNWHLECLDPPLAVPPPPRTWRCPAHVDDLLRSLPERLAPAHKYRKVKHAPVIEQIYSRGMANNGWIEIEEDSDDDDDADAWRQHKGYGRIFRLSEKGVKLDFISRVRENRRSQIPIRTRPPNPAFAVAPSARSLAEQQAALSLSQLAQGGSDGVNQLVQALVSEANPTIVSLMAIGDAERIANGNLSTTDVTALNAMLAQVDSMKSAITKVLASHNRPATPGTGHPATPAKTPEKTSSVPDNLSSANVTVGVNGNASAPDDIRERVRDEIIKTSKDDFAVQVD
ncbi:hypothetical protein DL771_000819 [Monosporascus sp. 5C6A]|nr:hypothetical protein DL771_000819 [Monosporascus sp. 5C6A]